MANTAPNQQERVAFYSPRPWTFVRFLFLVAAVCELIAALTVIGALSIGPVMAWVFGGLAAWLLTGAV